MEIGNRPDAYSSGYYLVADPQNRQVVSEIEQARAQQERQRERLAVVHENGYSEDDTQQTSAGFNTNKRQTDTYHTFYSQDIELDQSTRQALDTYRQVAMHSAEQHELMQRIDVLV